MIDINKVSEGIDYTIISSPIDNHSDAWFVSVLRGDFAGYSIAFNHVKIDGKTGTMSFTYVAVDANDNEVRSETLDDFSGMVLEDIIKTEIANGGIEFYGADSDNETVD